MELNLKVINGIKNELIKLINDEEYGLLVEERNECINLVNEFWIEGGNFESKINEWDKLGNVLMFELEYEKWDVTIDEIVKYLD